jgi:pyruvate kinase
VGRYPEEAVVMLAKIAAATEARRPAAGLSQMRDFFRHHPPTTAAEAMASVVEHALETVPCAAVFVPTRTGSTARMLARFKPSVWIAAVSQNPAVCQALTFSYGVHPIELAEDPEDWRDFATQWVRAHQVAGSVAMLAAGPSEMHPEANHRIEFLRMGGRPAAGLGAGHGRVMAC